jgi:hypothetical protein
MAVYHLELRSFPKAATLFNQSGQQVGALVLGWVQDRIVELDGENWAPWESTIAILEGPPIPVEGLSMGRGWKTALREGSDVTGRVLTEARRALADGSANQAPAGAEPADDGSGTAGVSTSAAAPPLAEDDAARGEKDPALAALLGPQAQRLLDAWQAVAARTSGLAPSELLALAERELRAEGRQP